MVVGDGGVAGWRGRQARSETKSVQSGGETADELPLKGKVAQDGHGVTVKLTGGLSTPYDRRRLPSYPAYSA